MFKRVKCPSNPAYQGNWTPAQVCNYSVDEQGNVIAVAVPADLGINVPQDGARLELRNVAKYGESLDDDRFINVNVMSPMKTADTIADAMREYNANVENYGNE